MTPTPLIHALALVLVTLGGCGAPDNDVPREGEPAPTDDAPAPAASTNAEGPAWTVTIDAAEAAPDLPDIEGDELDAARIGTALQLSGIDSDHALTVRVTVGDEVAAGDYGPSTFSITWPELDHTCVGGANAVTISVEAVEPVRGTFSGRVRCYASSSPTEAFEAQVTGTFRDTV